MKANRIDEFHKHNNHFYGKLVAVDYMTDMQNDPKWGTFNAGLTFDYLAKANALITERQYKVVKVLLSIPELVVEIE